MTRLDGERPAIKAWSHLLATLRSLLGGQSMLFTHSGDDGDENLLSVVEKLLDLVTDFTLGDLDIVLSSTGLVNQVHESVINVKEGVFVSGDVGDVHVVGGGGEIFHLLSVEDINSDEMDLGVSVLSGLGGGHVDDLAWSALDDDVSVLSESRALGWEGERGTSRCTLERLGGSLFSHCMWIDGF